MPSEGDKAYITAGDVLVVDKRRGNGFHPGIAKEIYAKGQERLKSPLPRQKVWQYYAIYIHLPKRQQQMLMRRSGITAPLRNKCKKRMT
ncbi:hypothetical protein IPL68_02920 [Candidatus Saccharibacteria bacterium]|nr:MAG: hypothetical protein IPL68_02920 [Candidatus Saccharibacteria bacterium]